MFHILYTHAHAAHTQTKKKREREMEGQKGGECLLIKILNV